MSLADIHTRAEKFQSRIRTRNWIEYAAGALVIFGFGWVATVPVGPIVQAACALIVVGTLYVMWKLATLARATGKVDDAVSWADFHRAELVRQRDALNGIWRWYLGPLVPGLLLFWIGVALTLTELPLAARLVTALLGLAIAAAAFFGIAYLNKRAARTLQAEIEALDRVRNG